MRIGYKNISTSTRTISFFAMDKRSMVGQMIMAAREIISDATSQSHANRPLTVKQSGRQQLNLEEI